MLGVSIVLLSTPACLAYAICTYRSSVATWTNGAALCLATLLIAPVGFGVAVAIVAALAEMFS